MPDLFDPFLWAIFRAKFCPISANGFLHRPVDGFFRPPADGFFHRAVDGLFHRPVDGFYLVLNHARFFGVFLW